MTTENGRVSNEDINRLIRDNYMYGKPRILTPHPNNGETGDNQRPQIDYRTMPEVFIG